MKRSARGFTLIEILVVMVIITILAGISVAMYGHGVEQAHEATLKTDLKEMREAIDAYHADKNKWPPSLDALATALRQQGLEVIEAENGLEVLLYVKRVRPGAVIVTRELPRVDGLEALRRIRVFDPGIRVVLIGPPSPEALTEGAVAVLPRPVEASDLMAALRTPAASRIPRGEVRGGRGVQGVSPECLQGLVQLEAQPCV